MTAPNEESSDIKSTFVAFVKLVIWALLIYVSGYFLLMARHWPAVDQNEEVVFKSAFRFAPYPHPVRLGEVTTVVGKVTFWNYIFYPLDVIYYRESHPPKSANSLPNQPKPTQ